MKYGLRIGYDIPSSTLPSLIVDVDSVIENEVDLESWTTESGGFEVKLPVNYVINNVKRPMLGIEITDGEIEVELALDFKMDESIAYVDSDNYAILNDYYTNYPESLVPLYIKSEKYVIIEINFYSDKALYGAVLEPWDTVLHRYQNYPRLNEVGAIASSYPITYVGRRVNLLDIISNKVVFEGVISEDPVLDGNFITFPVKSAIDALDMEIVNDVKEEADQEEVTFRDMLFPLEDTDRTGSIRTEFVYLPNLQMDPSLRYIDSTFKLGSFKSFKEILDLFCKINQVFLSFDSVEGVGGAQKSQYTFKSLQSINKQLDDGIETKTISSIKDIKRNIKCEKYNGVASVELEIGGQKTIVNNNLIMGVGAGSSLELKIPDTLVFKEDNVVRTFVFSDWIDKFFQTFGRIYQKITVPSSGSHATKFFQVGMVYKISDLADYRTFTSRDLIENESDLCFCLSITKDEVTFLHLRNYTSYPIPPSFIGTVSNIMGQINYYRGFEGYNYYDPVFCMKYPSNYSGLNQLEFPDSELKYFKGGYKVSITSIDKYPQTTVTSVIRSVSSALLTLIHDLSSSFTPGEQVLVTYANISNHAAGSDQSKWLYLL